MKTVFLPFEIHLTDPNPATKNPPDPPGTRVLELQTNPPGETSLQGTEKGIIRAPDGAAVEFGNSDNLGVPLPFMNILGPKPVGNYIYSAWFSAGNPDWSKNFPTNAATFVRKSGGWFGIPLLFGSSTRYYWRGVFVYDPPATSVAPELGLPARGDLAVRRWIDPGFACLGAAPGTPSMATQFDFTRDAGRSPDTFGFAMRGANTVRVHTITEHTGGGASVERRSWERLYIRLRKAGTGGEFWRSKNTAGASSGSVLRITPSGQISYSESNNVGTETLVGTVGDALVIDRWYRLDLAFRFNDGAGFPGKMWIYLDNVAKIVATPSGGGLSLAGFHTSSQIGQNFAGYDMEFDIGFWMNAKYTDDGLGGPALNGLDWLNGSKLVVVRPKAFAAGGSGWLGDWRTLANFPVIDNFGDMLTSTVALSELRLAMDTAGAVDAVVGGLGAVAMLVNHHGHRGTLQGSFGYKLGAAARVMTVFGSGGVNTEGATAASRGMSSIMATLRDNPGTDGVAPGPIVPRAKKVPLEVFDTLELHRIKGNDAVISGSGQLVAVVEVIGTFNDEDYPAAADPLLKNPLPFLGPHNAPYPRTPWARTNTPPISPVVIKGGTYVGNGTGQDLTFRSPVHFLWIRRVTNLGLGNTVMGRWWSTMLGATLAGQVTPQPWTIPDQLQDGGYAVVDNGTAPSGVGALPDRSAAVAAIVNIANNLALLDGNEDHKRDLLGVVIRELNRQFPADGNNWGFLSKTDRDPDFTPADILMWNPTRDHIDVLSDTGPVWIPRGVPVPEWIWVKSPAEGAQETSSIIRIAGANDETNRNGETYQYIAVADPGQRFMLNGAVVLDDLNANINRPLIDSRFLPKFVFLEEQRTGSAPDTNITVGVKGPGHAAGAVSLLDNAGTQRAGAFDMSLGFIKPQATFNFSARQGIVYSAWRDDDGSNDPGVHRVVQIVSYVGNGLGTRDIALIPNSGKFPLWAMVVPHGERPYMKDASHTGGAATGVDGNPSATAIVAGGIDFLRVGATLNTNAVTYNVFVIPGGDVAGADGFSVNGEYIPVEPAIAPGSQWGAQPEEPTLAETVDPGTGVGPGGGLDDIDTDIAAACLPASTRVCNIALGKIGISQTIASLGTDLTENAAQMRLHYATELEATLRSYPWAFATKYDSALTFVAGTEAVPVNDDWLYAYRPPLDCVFVRRIVTLAKRGFEPAPELFRIGQDATGDVIFTNRLDPTIEYTCRPDCSAGRGDALFRAAFAWRLAAAVAPALTRIKGKEEQCLMEFEKALERARVADNREQQQDVEPPDAEWIRGRD